MNKNKFHFYSLEELNKKEKVNGIVNCYISEDIQFKMLCANNDCSVSRRFFWNNCYEKKTLDLWSKLSKKINGNIILDIGAHTGVYSLCSSVSNKSNTVLSFEPFFMNYARMSTNFKINNLNPNNLFMFAVGNNNQMTKIKINTNIHFLSSGGSIMGKEGFELPVQEISIDNFIKNEDKSKIGIVKIDVEGYEPNVINGFREIMNLSHPIIFFECNQEHVAEFFNANLEKDYIFYEVNDKELTVKKVNKLVSSKDYCMHNRIAIPRISKIRDIFKSII